jgi:hypothetical protein
MKISSQSNIRRPQPPIGKKLDFVQKLMHNIFWVSEHPTISFAPDYPHTGKPGELQERPSSTEATRRISELDEMVCEAEGIHRWEPNPRPDQSPKRAKSAAW